MAKIPFRGIAQIVTAKQPPPLPVTASPPPTRQQAQAEGQPSIRPIGYSAVEDEAASPRATMARWWSAIKRLFLVPPR